MLDYINYLRYGINAQSDVERLADYERLKAENEKLKVERDCKLKTYKIFTLFNFLLTLVNIALCVLSFMY